MTAAELAEPRSAASGGWLTADRARVIGWTAFAVGSVLRLIQLWLTSRIGPDSVRFTFEIGVPTFLAAIVLGTASSVVGALIVARRPGNAVGWVYVVTGLLQGLVTAGLAYAAVTLSTAQAATAPETFGRAMAWLNGVVDYSIPFSFAAVVLALFPDGHLVSSRWRPVIVLAVVGGIVRAIEVGFSEPSMVLLAGSANPYRLDGPIGGLFATSARLGIGSLLVEAAFVLATISLAVRYRSASLDGRRQIRWLVVAGFLALLSTAPLLYGTLVPGGLPAHFDALALMFATLSLAPIATLIAIRRYRLYEIDRIVNRAVLYGSLTAILAGVFTAGIALAQRLFTSMTGERSDAAIVLTTLVVATLYAPLRKRLEHIIDARFRYDAAAFGAYRSAIDAVRAVVEPGAAAARLAAEAVDGMNAVGAAVIGPTGVPLATAGSWPTTAELTIPLGDNDLALRTLLVGPRRDGKPHDPVVAAGLADVARLAATSVLARAKAEA
jgi:hypothetical protein